MSNESVTFVKWNAFLTERFWNGFVSTKLQEFSIPKSQKKLSIGISVWQLMLTSYLAASEGYYNQHFVITLPS
jgi:hypothetical protein